MKKVKFHWITIISFFAALLLLLGVILALPENKKALASSYSPSSIFAAGTSGTVEASAKIGEGDDAKAYVQFSIAEGGKVHYRRNLALRWFTGKNQKGYFSMDLSFPEVLFEEFTITFESAEENISKDSKATNAIVFKKGSADDTLQVWVRDANYEEPKAGENEEIETSATVSSVKDIHFEIDEGTDETDCKSGEFRVMVKNEGDATLQHAGTLTNVGGYYLEYRSSSSSKPNTPMTFSAKLPSSAASGTKQLVHMKSLNTQSLVLNSDNKVEDNASAVLVLNEKLYAFKLGQKYSLTYEAIDVCRDSVTTTKEYYMLKYADDIPVRPNVDKLEGNDKEKADPYNYKKLDTSTYFLPSQENANQLEHVSIRFLLEDNTKENDKYVYLDWYADEDAISSISCDYYVDEADASDADKKVTVKKTEGDQVSFDFIKVDRDKKGPVYLGLELDTVNKKNVYKDETKFNKAVQNYQDALDDAASYEKHKTSAGTGAYIYLPSLRDLIGSDYADYRNLKFSIYYYKPSHSATSSSSSQTSLSYNALKLEITEKGVYKIRVIAQDASGNAMQYYYENELVTLSSSNVWEIEEIPEFTFEVDYKGPKIEEVKEKDLGYRNDTYTFDNFDIVALSGYKKEYTLYRFDSGKLKEGQSLPTYSDFVSNAQKYSTENYRDCLVEISEFQDDVKEEDETLWNRTDNAYYWNPDSSLSFVPQEACFYVLKLTVKDAVLPGESATAYQVIEVRNPIDTIPAESQWLQENVVSVVLFAVSGVLAIIVLILFLIKPSDKKVEEIDLDKLKGKKKQKNEPKTK